MPRTLGLAEPAPVEPADNVNAYDEVTYPSAVYAQTHPDRLATVGTLFGMNPPPVEKARILELGCGDGLNLIAMAYGLPDATCLGVDLAAKPIAAGQDVIRELGLKNIDLQRASVTELNADDGSFDYIIAHGLYSWVPEEVRDAIMAILGRHLTENGVAYLSYNAYPGNHFRDLGRGMMRYHLRRFEAPAEQVEQSRAFLKYLAKSKDDPDLYRLVLDREAERLVDYAGPSVYHDDLSAVNQPFYLYQVMEQAEKQGLQFLGEADFADMVSPLYAPGVVAKLRHLAPDIVAREQYLDFLSNRCFRQTLLCRQGIHLRQQPPKNRVEKLYVSALLEPVAREGAATVFANERGSEMRTQHPIVTASIAVMSTRWPEVIDFDGLCAQAAKTHAEFQGETSVHVGQDDRNAIASAILTAYEGGLVDIHTSVPRCTRTVSERPKASALARARIRAGDPAPTLRHKIFRLEDALSRGLLAALDGTRDREAIGRALAELVARGEAGFSVEGKSVTNSDEAFPFIMQQLPKKLKALAELAVLEKD